MTEKKNIMDENWKNADFNPELDVGELHFVNNLTELYYHSSRAGGKGGTDIWYTENVNGEWQQPVNIESINSEVDLGQGRPYSMLGKVGR